MLFVSQASTCHPTCQNSVAHLEHRCAFFRLFSLFAWFTLFGLFTLFALFGLFTLFGLFSLGRSHCLGCLHCLCCLREPVFMWWTTPRLWAMCRWPAVKFLRINKRTVRGLVWLQLFVVATGCKQAHGDGNSRHGEFKGRLGEALNCTLGSCKAAAGAQRHSS